MQEELSMYDLSLIAFSVLIALIATYAAVYLSKRIGGRRCAPRFWGRLIVAISLGLTVSLLHYGWMYGKVVVQIEQFVPESSLIRDAEMLSVSIGIGAIMIQLLVLLGALLDRRQALMIAKRSDQRFQSLFAHSPFAVCLFDLNGRMLDVNRAAERLLNDRRDQLLDRSFRSLSPILQQEQVELMERFFQQAIAGATPTYEICLQQPSGALLNLQITNVPVLIDDQIDGAYLIAKDISEQKRAEELVHRSDKLSAVGQLAAGIAHEIRNPLTAIKGFTQLLQEGAQRDVQYYQVILSELDRVNLIVDEFLLLAKPSPSMFRSCNVEQMLLAIITLLEPQAILQNVRILPTIAAGIDQIEIEENQIKQVLINLLKNAIEAMPDGGDLIIELRQEEEGLMRIRFIDQGCGIPEEQLHKVGDPFFTTKEKGTGLGLMVSHKIIEDHGGQLEIHSTVGVGTTIDVLLPLSLEEEKELLLV